MAVYFIQARDGAVKIGRATNVDQRLRNLQTAHAYELDLLRVIDGGEIEEWECHQEFAELRIRGEWFEYSDAMLSFIPSDCTKVGLLSRHRNIASKTTRYAPNSLTAYIRETIKRSATKQKDFAQLMGMSPIKLNRKLSDRCTESLKFTIDDVERFIQVTDDISPVLYLVEKYCTKHDRIAELEEELARLKQSKRLSAA